MSSLDIIVECMNELKDVKQRFESQDIQYKTRKPTKFREKFKSVNYQKIVPVLDKKNFFTTMRVEKPREVEQSKNFWLDKEKQQLIDRKTLRQFRSSHNLSQKAIQNRNEYLETLINEEQNMTNQSHMYLTKNSSSKLLQLSELNSRNNKQQTRYSITNVNTNNTILNNSIIQKPPLPPLQEEQKKTFRIQNISNFKLEPLKKYDAQIMEDTEIEAFVQNRISQNLTVQGYSRFKDPFELMSWVPCEVIGFNPRNQEYEVRFFNGNKLKWVTRSNLVFMGENMDEYLKRFNEADSLRREQLLNLSLNINVAQLAETVQLSLSDHISKGIINRTFTREFTQYKDQTLHKVIEEILKHYKFYVLRFITAFQQDNNLDRYFKKFLPYEYDKKLEIKPPNQALIQIECTEEHIKYYHYDSMKGYFQNHLKQLHEKYMGTAQISDLKDRPRILLMIVKIFDALQNVKDFQLFHGYTQIAKLGQVDANNIHEICTREFKTTQEKIEILIYRAEKSIEKLGLEVLLSYQKQMEKTLNRDRISYTQYRDNYIYGLAKNANIILTSCLQFSIEESFEEIIKFHFKYFLTLPVPNITQEDLKLLPHSLVVSLYKARDIFMLNDDLMFCQNGTFNIQTQFEQQQQILFFSYCSLIKQCLDGRKNTLENPPITILGLNPVIQIKLQTAKHKKHHVPYNIFKFLIIQRQKIYECESQRKKIIFDLYKINFQDYPTDYNEYLKLIQNKNVTMGILGWFNFKNLRISISPKLDQVETQLKTAFDLFIHNICNIEEIYGYKNNRKVNLYAISQYEAQFRQQFDYFLEHSFLGAMALTWIFNQFDFYLQEKNYIDAFLQIFEGSVIIKNNQLFSQNNTRILNEERLCLMKDLDFVQNLQPDSFCIGLLRIDVKEVKQTLVTAIEKNIQIIDDSFCKRVAKLLNETEELVVQVQSKLSKSLTSIQNYIEQVQFMKEKQIERMQEKISFNLGVCQNIINSIEIFQIPLNLDIYDNFLSSVRWQKIIEEEIDKAKEVLSNLAPEFQNMVNQDNELIQGTFEIIQHDILKFHKEYDLIKVQDHLQTAKHLEDQLLEVEHRTNALNEQIKYLRLPSIDTSFVTEEIKNFSFYVNFWEIAEKIKYHSETWLKGPFITSDIEEITEVCRDGTHIINTLRKTTQTTLASSPDIKGKFNDSLSQLEQQIEVFNKNLNLFILLKDRNFKENQWDEFIEIMFKGKPLPDLTKLSMYDLMQENIQNYQQEIIDISNLAKRNTYLDNQFSQLDSQIKEFTFKFVPLEEYGYKNLQRIRSYKQSKMTLKEIIFECWQLGSKEISQQLKQKLLSQEVALKACKKIMTYKVRLQGFLLQILPIMEFTTPQEKSYLQQYRDELMKFYDQVRKINLQFFSQYVNNDTANPGYDKSFKNELDRTTECIEYLRKIISSFHKKWEHLLEEYPRLYMINEHQLANLFISSFMKAGAIRLFLRLYPSIKSTDMNINNNQIKINLVSDHYNEDFFAVKEITHPIIQYQNQQLVLGLVNCAKEMEQQYKASIKRNIFIHLGKLGKANYNFNKIWKFIQIRQMYFQSVLVCLDIQFAHDLTIMLLNHNDRTTRRIIEDFQNFLMNNLNQFKANQIESNKKLFSQGLFHIYNQLILKIIYYRDVLELFLQFYEISKIELTPYRLNSFEYMALPKFTLEYDTKTALDKSQNENLQNLTDTHIQYESINFFKQMYNPVELYKNQLIQYNNILNQSNIQFPLIKTKINDNFNSACGISFICMTSKLNYGYDIMDYTPLFVTIPQSDRNLLWIIQSLSSSQAIILKNGTSTQFKQLSATLGQTYYEYDGVFLQSFQAVQQIVQGLFMGGFYVHVRNSEIMDPLCLINFNNQIQEIKQNLILTDQLKNHYFNLCLCYTKEFNFNSIIIQNFRVINLISGQEALIIRHLLFILGLEERSDEVAKGLLYIFGYIQEQFFYHLQQQTHNSANSTIPIDQISKYLGTTQIIKLINQSIQKMRVAFDQENVLDPFDTIRYNLDQYFKNLLNSDMYEIYQNIQQLVLPQHTTLKYLEQQEDKKKYDYIKECHHELKSSMTVNLAVIAYNFSLALERKEVITLVGKSFYEQEQILAYGSFIKSRYISKFTFTKLLLLDGIFLLHYFPLFAMNENLKFGTNEKHSIFYELIRYLNGEQLNYYEIYSKPSRQSDTPKTQIAPSLNDWMILQFHEIGTMEENIISQCNDHSIMLKSDIVKFPISIRQIILLDDLSNLSPKSVSAMNIINVNSEIFNFNQEFEQWLTNKAILQSQFYDRFKMHLQLNFLHFFEDICSYIFLQNLQYKLTKRTVYFQLLKMIDILLNEIRKKEIAHGFTGYKDLTLEEKKLFSFDPNQLQSNSEIKELFLSKDLMIKRDKTISESIFILSLMLGPLSLFDKSKQIQVSNYLKKRINELMAIQYGKCETYAQDILQIVDENNIFNYNFDIKQEKWIEWDEFQFDFTEYKYFQSSLNSNIISATELVRLNPSSKDLTQVQNQIAIEMHFQKPSTSVQQNIKSQNKLLYSINLQLLYQKQVILIGNSRTGKTKLLQNFINQYNQIENMKPVYYSVIEDNTKILHRLLDQSANIGQTLSNRKKCISLFIDDVHLSQSTELLINSLGQYNGYYSDRQGQFVQLIRFNSLIVSQKISTISENAFFNVIEKIEIPELEQIYSSEAQKFVLNVLHLSVHQNEQLQNILQSPLLTAIFNNPFIIEQIEDNMNLINLISSLKIFFPCDDFPQLIQFKDDIQKLIESSNEVEGDLYYQMGKRYSKWIDNLINNTAISADIDRNINQTFVTLASMFANMNGIIKSPIIETKPDEFKNFYEKIRIKISLMKTLDKISLKVINLSQITIESYFIQLEAMLKMTNNLIMCETDNEYKNIYNILLLSINIYQYLMLSFTFVQVIQKNEWQQVDFGKKLRIQAEKSQGIVQVCFIIERNDDFMKLFNILNLLLWTTFYENTTPYIINSQQNYSQWIRQKLKIIIITNISLDQPVIKKAKLSGQIVFLRSPKIHETVSTTSEKFQISKELLQFSQKILKNPNIITDIDIDELDLRLSLGSLILKILESEIDQKEERIKQETTYNTLKNLISLKLKIFQQAYEISPGAILQKGFKSQKEILNDRLLKVQNICHTIEKTVLKSYVQFRLGLNEGKNEQRNVQIYLLAVYISCFCIMNEQQVILYYYHSFIRAQSDSLDEYIFWITNVAGISLNGRGEDYLFYRTSYAGNRFLQHNFSFVKFFLQTADSPFLLLIDPNQQIFNQIRQLIFKQSSKAYSVFQHQNYIFDDKEKLIETMKIGGVYVAVQPNMDFQKVLKKIAVQWLVALNTKYINTQQDQGTKLFEIQLEEEIIKAKSSFKLIIITGSEYELNVWDKNFLRTLIIINFTTTNPDHFIHSLGDIILNNLYSNQKRNIMSHYLKSIELQIKLQESPYIKLIEQMEQLDYSSDETINDLSQMKFSKFSYHFQDLLEEQLSLQINLSKLYQTDPEILKQQKQLYQRVGKQGIGQNVIQIIKSAKKMTLNQDEISDDDESEQSDEEIPIEKSKILSQDDDQKSEQSDEDLDDLMEDDDRHDSTVYMFIRTMGVEPLDHIFIIPKLQKLINPFMPYLEFICFLWETYQIFQQKFGTYFITDQFFHNILSKTCMDLVEGKLNDMNAVYKIKESLFLDAMKSSFQYIANALGQCQFNIYCVLLCKNYMETYKKHNEYLWQLLIRGSCEKLLPQYLNPYSKEWQSMEQCRFQQDKNPLYEIEDRYQSLIEFDYEHGALEESEFSSSRDQEKQQFLMNTQLKKEQIQKNIADQLMNKWQDKKNKRISMKNDTRKRQSLVRQNILPLDIMKIMDENQIQKSDSQSESDSENDKGIKINQNIFKELSPQLKRKTRTSGRQAFSLPTNASLIGRLTTNINKTSIHHSKEKLFNLKSQKKYNELENIQLNSELMIPDIINLKDENLQSLKLLRKNVNQFYVNLIKNLLIDNNLRLAINSILINQSSIIDFLFQELTQWPWHDKVLFMPASIIQYNLSEYAYAVLMKYLRPDEFYRQINKCFILRFMPKLFYQTTSEVFQLKINEINQDHKEQKINIIILDDLNLQNSIQEMLEWSYITLQKKTKHYIFKQNTQSQLLEILNSTFEQILLYNLINASVEEIKILLENQSASQQLFFIMTEKEFYSRDKIPQYLLQLLQFSNIINIGKVQGIKDLLNIYFKNELDNFDMLQMETGNSIKSIEDRRPSPRKRHSIDVRNTQSNLNISTFQTSPYYIEDYKIIDILKPSIYQQQNHIIDYFKTYNITIYQYAFCQFYEFYQRSDLIREDGLENSIQFVQKNKYKFIYNISLLLIFAKNQYQELKQIQDQQIRDFVEQLTQTLLLFPTNPFIFTIKYLNSFIPIFNHNSYLLDSLLLIFFPTRKGKDIRLEIDGLKLPLFHGDNKKETMMICLNELPIDPIPYRLFDKSINSIHLKNTIESQKMNQQIIQFEQEEEQKSLYQKQVEISMFEHLKQIQQNILTQFKSELYYLLNFILDTPVSEEELAVGFQSNEELQIFLKRYDEQFSLSNVEPLKSYDSQPDILVFEKKSSKLQNTIKSKVMSNIAQIKKQTQFKITGKTFAKTLHQMSIKSRNYLQGLQQRTSGINAMERRPYLLQVLKNSTLIQMILLNEVCTQIQQQRNLQNNMQYLIYLHKSQSLNNMIYKHQTNVRNIIEINSLWDVQGLIICMIFHFAINNKVNLMDVKIKINRIKSKSFLIKQDYKLGIHLKGIRIYHGSLNATSNFLQEEKSMEFWSDIGLVQLRPVEQNLPKNYVKSFVNIYKNKKLQLPEVSIEFQDKVHDNLHQEFLDQQSQILNVLDFEFNQHYFDQEIPSIVEASEVVSKKRYMQDRKSDQKLYFVRIPVRTQRKNMLLWWLYLKSHKPQDFWIRKGTYASIDIPE